MDPQRVNPSKNQPVSKSANETVGNSDDCFESQVPRSSASHEVNQSISADDVHYTSPPVRPHVPDEAGDNPPRYRRQQSDPLGVTGKVLNDRYEVTTYISRGSFGYVYRGRDKRFDRGDDSALVAIKFMQLTPNNRSGFEREAQLMKRFHHPHFVDVYDFGDDADGLSWLVMEYLAGRTLDEVLKHANGPADRSLVIKFAEQVLPAMNSAHRKNLIHRDLKPANIMVINDDDPDELRFKIMDFGTSAQVDATDTLANQTMKSAGTPMFMAPEQVSGATSSPRSDLYSIGVILFQMLSGRLPFELKSVPKVLHDVVYAAPPKLSAVAPRGTVSRELDRLISECLAKNPSARPADLNVVRDQLLKILGTPALERRWGLHLIRLVSVLSLIGVVVLFTNLLDRGYFKKPVGEQTDEQHVEEVTKNDVIESSNSMMQSDPVASDSSSSESNQSVGSISEPANDHVSKNAPFVMELPLVSFTSVVDAMKTAGGSFSTGVAASARDVSVASSSMSANWAPHIVSVELPVVLDRVHEQSQVSETIVILEDLTADEPADALMAENIGGAASNEAASIEKKDPSETSVNVVRRDEQRSDSKMDATKTSTSVVDSSESKSKSDVPEPPKMTEAERLLLEKQNREIAVKLNRSGVELQSAGKHAEAIDVFDDAIRLDDKQVLAFLHRAGSKLHLGDREGAISDYNEAILLDPKNVDARLGRGDILRQLGQLEKALADLNEAITLDESRAVAFNSRSLIHLHKGDLKQALADADKAVSLNPKVAEYFNNRGNVHRSLRELDKAIHDYTEASRLSPTFATALVNRGIAWRELGDRKRALADFNAVLFFDLNNKDAQKELSETVKEKK